MLVYESLNNVLMRFISKDIKNVLDIGCGSGLLGKHVKNHVKDVYVTGITYSNEEAILAKKVIDKIVVANLNTISLAEYGKFDCVICSHVLEHLYEPEQLLKKIKAQLLPDGILIVALPNILYYKQRIKFLNGSFKYTDGGLMDKTHYRFFDWQTAQNLITESGFIMTTKFADGAFPLSFLRSILGKKLSQKIDRLACIIFPGLFGFQFVFCCKVDI